MNNLFIKTAHACSVVYDPNHTGGHKSINWKSLIISSDECGTSYRPSSFIGSLIISVVFGLILFFLFRKLKTGIQKKYMRIIIQIAIVPLLIIFLFGAWTGIGFIIGLFM